MNTAQMTQFDYRLDLMDPRVQAEHFDGDGCPDE